MKHNCGYILSPEVQKAWYTLKKCLTFISSTLLNGAFQNPEAKFGLDSSFWPLPSECGYTKVHKDEYSAHKAASRSQDACAVLTVRCTMAIALVTTDPNTNPPQWCQKLTDKGVPAAWIDMLRDSVITDPSPGLCVSAFISLSEPMMMAWINHVPRMIHANLPVYISWCPSSGEENLLCILQEFLFLCTYVPNGHESYVVPHPKLQTSFQWPQLLELGPWHQVPPLMIPCGQRQHPGETFLDFFT